jgi:hypothetical protein
MTNSLRFALVTALKATLDLHKILHIGSHPLLELGSLCDSLHITLNDDDKIYFMEMITRMDYAVTN